MPQPAWTATFPDWTTGNPSPSMKFDMVPWRDDKHKDNNPEVEVGPRADTTGCSDCKTIEADARIAYLQEVLDWSTEPNEAEQRNRFRAAWILYLDTVYDCFQSSGCFGVGG
jgi:hypothetical protein